MSVTATHAEVGPMISGGDVEESVITTLKRWLPSYLREGERQHLVTVGQTPEPRSWGITGRDLQKLTSDQLPSVVIMAGGIMVPPHKEGMGHGNLTATWSLELAVIFNAAWDTTSRWRAQLYAVAMRTCMIQRPLEGPLAAIGGGIVDHRSERYDELNFADTRTYSASVVGFGVEVRGIGWVNGGPPVHVEPPEDPNVPYEEWVRVREADVTVTQRS